MCMGTTGKIIEMVTILKGPTLINEIKMTDILEKFILT